MPIRFEALSIPLSSQRGVLFQVPSVRFSPLGNHPAVQNMLLAARAFISRKKRRTRSACRAVSIPMPCCRSATQWDGLGRFGPVRRIALADVVYEDGWGQP